MQSFDKLTFSRQLGAFLGGTLLVLLALFEFFMAFWVSFGYPPPTRPWWEFLTIALFWLLPAVQFVGIVLLFIPTRAEIGFGLAMGNITVFGCIVLYPMMNAAVLAKTSFLVSAIWLAILLLAGFAATSLKNLVSGSKQPGHL